MVVMLLADVTVALIAIIVVSLLLGSLTLVGHACVVVGGKSAPAEDGHGHDTSLDTGPLVAFVMKGYGLAMVAAQLMEWCGGPIAAYTMAAGVTYLRNDQSLHVLLEPPPGVCPISASSLFPAPPLHAVATRTRTRTHIDVRTQPAGALDLCFGLLLLPGLCAPALVLHGFGAAWFAFLCLAYLWRTTASASLLHVLGGLAKLLAAYAFAWGVGLFAPLVAFRIGDWVLIVSGAVALSSCPRSLALACLPIALVWSPATQRFVGSAFQYAVDLAWRGSGMTLSLLPSASDWLRYASQACSWTVSSTLAVAKAVFGLVIHAATATFVFVGSLLQRALSSGSAATTTTPADAVRLDVSHQGETL